MDQPAWIKDEIAELVKEHGAVPPPWFVFPNTHPYDICWRMGAGESHVMIFGVWWDQQKETLDEAQRLEYFRQWPPPPRWLTWMIDTVWDLHPWDSEDPDSFDYSPYFERTKALGFGTKEEYEHDLNNWCNEEEEEEEEDEEEDDDDEEEEEGEEEKDENNDKGHEEKKK